MVATSALGLSAFRIRGLLADGSLVRVRRGVVVGRCVAEAMSRHDLHLRALLVSYPEAVAGYESAATCHTLPQLGAPQLPVLIRAAGAWRGGGARVRIAPLPAEHLAEVTGVRCTSVARTVVDLARTSGFAGAVMAGDAAVRRGYGKSQLRRVAAECASWSDGSKVGTLIDFLDGRAESPLESLSRVRMHEAGLPPPELQAVLVVGPGRYRVDFYWDSARLIGEADGRGKYDASADSLWREKLREDALRDAGYVVVRWTYAQLATEPEAVMARLRRRLCPG